MLKPHTINHLCKLLNTSRVKVLGVVLFLSLWAVCSWAQSEFDLKFKQGHYYFDATINGTLTKDILMETGLHGISIREDLFEEIFPEHQFKKVEKHSQKITILGKGYKVKEVWKAITPVGEYAFVGFIFVMENKSPVRCGINVQNLVNLNTPEKNYLNINFKTEKLTMVGISQLDTTQLYKMPLIEWNPWPITECAVTIAQEEKRYTLKGKFMIDFGNANDLTLFENKYIANFLLKTGFKVSNIEGHNYLDAGSLTIAGKKFPGSRIGIIHSVNQYFGFFGPAFFKGNVFLTPKRDCLYFE